ncbi:MAG: saccharopine dehydrogenase, partial [Pseudomonadota bacterium]
MIHLWVRAEPRDNEQRVGITPDGVAALIRAGFRITVEDDPNRAIPIAGYVAAGADIAAPAAWRTAPPDAIIFGLKELPDDGHPLPHRHIMFGHAYKGQPAGQRLLKQFKAGGGILLDIEYLTTPTGQRVAAFGYWAGYAGAAVALLCWAAQLRGQRPAPVTAYDSAMTLRADLQTQLAGLNTRPTALIIGAQGRVGGGVADFCTHLGVPTTQWDLAETAHGGPYPEILAHDIFFNCIVARPGTPVFIPPATKIAPRSLSIIADIACDPDSDFSPIQVYSQATTWDAPARRVHDQPALDVT